MKYQFDKFDIYLFFLSHGGRIQLILVVLLITTYCSCIGKALSLEVRTMVQFLYAIFYWFIIYCSINLNKVDS